MTDSVAVVEYGSHTFRAGLAYNFPSDHEPRLVRGDCMLKQASTICSVHVVETSFLLTSSVTDMAGNSGYCTFCPIGRHS